MWVASGHLPQSSLQAVAGVTSRDMDVTCNILAVDVDILAYSLGLACDARILELELAWLDSRIHLLLLKVSGNSGLKSILVLVGCNAGSLSGMAFAAGY